MIRAFEEWHELPSMLAFRVIQTYLDQAVQIDNKGNIIIRSWIELFGLTYLSLSIGISSVRLFEGAC